MPRACLKNVTLLVVLTYLLRNTFIDETRTAGAGVNGEYQLRLMWGPMIVLSIKSTRRFCAGAGL